MTQKQLEKYLDKVWGIYAHKDRHGYQDHMFPDDFRSAVRLVLQDCGVDVTAVKTPKR